MNKKSKRKTWVLIASVILCLLITVGGTLAYIIVKTEKVDNEFVPGQVACKIEENFSNNVKKDVLIRNVGNTDAYIRAMVIVNWVSETEKGTVLSITPVEGEDYSVEWGAFGWKKGTDGFWYYETFVVPQDVTKNLIEEVTLLKKAPEGYRLNVQILTTAIQAMPEDVVESEWNVRIEEGNLSCS